MEALAILLVLYLVAVLVLLPIWTIIKLRSHRDLIETLLGRIDELEMETKQLRGAARGEIAPTPAPTPAEPLAPIAPPAPVASDLAPPETATPAMDITAAPFFRDTAAPTVAPEPPPLPPVMTTTAMTEPTPEPEPVAEPRARFNWEQFFGAKFFAWAGGLALFLGVAFFVKYSFDHDLIPPEVRVAIGFVLGAGLVVGGLRIAAGRYRILAQSLIATGIVSLYAVTFACNSIYHFAFFGTFPTFLLMVLITTAAFVLAVRLEAQVVAILGLLGGFLTPVLLSTGVDNPGGLFGYLALLNIGLAGVALHRRWPHLLTLGAAGTVVMTVGWAGKFYIAEKTPVAMTVCLGFSALFLAVHAIAQRLERGDRWITIPAAAMPFVAFGFALMFLDYPAAATRAGLFFGFVLLADAALLALAWRDDSLSKLHAVAGAVAFAVLGFWTVRHLDDTLLPWALAGYLAFGALHTAFPLLLERHRPAAAPVWWSQLVPPLTLVLMLLPLARLDGISFLIWPAILLVDLIAIGLAVMSASLAAVAAVLVLTLCATGLWLLKVPAALLFPPSLPLVIGGFAVFFFAAGFWLVRKLGDRLPDATEAGPLTGVFGDLRTQIPAFSSLLPFLLLIMACARLAVPDPSMVFGLALLLVVLTLGLSRLMLIEWLPACALAGVAGLEYAWHARHFNSAAPAVPLLWYLGFYAVFSAFPFAFLKRFAGQTGPWAVSALAGAVQFPLVHRILRDSWPTGYMGLLPAMFALPPLIGLVAILQSQPADNPKRLNQLAWFGGVALLFITLVFPIQFDHQPQWLTVAWALEGAALLWLFHRVPHPGLRLVGAVLLGVAFARLALNPAVFRYHVQDNLPVLNWYLYAYGTVTAALFAGARLLAPPRERVLGVNVPPLLQTLGVVLAFLLLNIEIADYFAPDGAWRLRFNFFGRDVAAMTYTIAWALFALGLLVAGIRRQLRIARYAAIALLGVALAKLFLSDLARLGSLYQIGALFGVAIVAIAASFAYQKFQSDHE